MGLAHGALAMMYQENWCENDAREAFERAIALNQNDPSVLFYFGALNWWTGHPEEAVRLVQQAATLDPNDAFTNAIMGLVYQGVGKTEAAAEVYRKSIEVNPSSPILYICLSFTAGPLGNESEALEALKMVDQLMPDDASPQVIANIGWGYRVVGQHEAAEKIYNKVRKIAENRYVDPIAWTWAYRAKGDDDKAYEALAMAAENRTLVSDIFPAQFTYQNFYGDPVLEEPRFVELRKKLKYTQD